MKSKKSHKVKTIIYWLPPCDNDLKVYGFYCGESQTRFRFRTTPIKCMKVFFGKVCTFWSPRPTMTCPAISLPFIRKWVRGIAIASGAFCLSETGCLHHPTGRHNRLLPHSMQSNNRRLHLWWYCVMKTISRTMVEWLRSSPEPELLLQFAHVRSQVLMERMRTDDGSPAKTGAIFWCIWIDWRR